LVQRIYVVNLPFSARENDVETRLTALRRRLGDRQTIVRVDRTELSKNISRGLLAYLFLRYAFSVMEQAARGDSDPDSPDLSMWGGKDYRPLKQTVVFLFYVAILVGLGAAVGISQAPAIDPAVQQQAAVAPQPEAEAVEPLALGGTVAEAGGEIGRSVEGGAAAGAHACAVRVCGV